MTRWLLAALLAVPAVVAAQSGGQTGFEAAEAAAQEDPREVVGAPRGTALSGAALDARTEEVSALLRCPVCQGLSVADSPASMATNMKARRTSTCPPRSASGGASQTSQLMPRRAGSRRTNSPYERSK